jgi:hypothetical protein
MSTISISLSDDAQRKLITLIGIVGENHARSALEAYQNMLIDTVMKLYRDSPASKDSPLDPEGVVVQILRAAEPFFDKTVDDVYDIVSTIDFKSDRAYRLLSVVITTGVAEAALNASRTLGCVPKIELELKNSGS